MDPSIRGAAQELDLGEEGKGKSDSVTWAAFNRGAAARPKKDD